MIKKQSLERSIIQESEEVFVNRVLTLTINWSGVSSS